MSNPSISIIIPAYNEEKLLPSTLQSIQRAAYKFESLTGRTAEIIVVDNASTDRTALVAAGYKAHVVYESRRSIAAARNSGAAHTRSKCLFFVDADTTIPDDSLGEITTLLENGFVIGGALAPVYKPTKLAIQLLCRLWEWYALRRRMAQGVAMFCSKTAFAAVGGFDETLYMAEDTDFYWRLQEHARLKSQSVSFLPHLPVHPSLRRYELWPAWKIIFWTNPIITRLFLRSRKFWNNWYIHPPR